MATAEPLPTGQEIVAAPVAPTQSERTDDEAFTRHVKRVVFIAIPLFAALWIGVVALAVTFSDVGYGPPLAMGAAVGVLAGIFWTGWYAFVAFGHHEEAERRASRVR